MQTPDSMKTSFRRRDYFKIAMMGLALTALWQSLHSIVLPLRLLDFVAESQKNTYLGLMTLTGLLLAMLVQPVAGAISDRSGSRWGRRRPYILAGGLLVVIFVPGVGLAGGYAVIFIVYCFLQAASNTAQGPFQAFIPDLVPGGKRGLASGVKSLMEIIGGAALVYVSGILMDHYTGREGATWLWLTLVILAVVMLFGVLVTVFGVRESTATPSRVRTPLFTGLRRTVAGAMANPDMRWFLGSRLLVFMAFTTIQQFALYFLRDVIGVANPAEATARFTVLAVAGMLAVAWPAGHFSDRIGRKPIIVVSGLLGATGISLIFVFKDYNVILGAAGLIGLAMGAYNTTSWALATDLAVGGEEARYLAIANAATAGGAALSRAIGPAIDFFNGSSPGLGYQVMLGACLIYFVTGALLVLGIRHVN